MMGENVTKKKKLPVYYLIQQPPGLEMPEFRTDGLPTTINNNKKVCELQFSSLLLITGTGS
jgi:hypothetical protein